eukprot:CAMPEP_0115667536 /NCGR_PEP_ID=MMETSP0272-20121206/49995_1 /TAXON_ID=71861 /ORGANISM="Scrippsiella trochoidea, Strain CCMP3099" /LENGTH=393 /DNA_ID=CAMNT_0003106095 /DNA_START=45 /DNA_END=1226 /DNA_ORIENTATION=-
MQATADKAASANAAVAAGCSKGTEATAASTTPCGRSGKQPLSRTALRQVPTPMKKQTAAAARAAVTSATTATTSLPSVATAPSAEITTGGPTSAAAALPSEHGSVAAMVSSQGPEPWALGEPGAPVLARSSYRERLQARGQEAMQRTATPSFVGASSPASSSIAAPMMMPMISPAAAAPAPQEMVVPAAASPAALAAPPPFMYMMLGGPDMAASSTTTAAAPGGGFAPGAMGVWPEQLAMPQQQPPQPQPWVPTLVPTAMGAEASALAEFLHIPALAGSWEEPQQQSQESPQMQPQMQPHMPQQMQPQMQSQQAWEAQLPTGLGSMPVPPLGLFDGFAQAPQDLGAAAPEPAPQASWCCQGGLMAALMPEASRLDREELAAQLRAAAPTSYDE